MSNNRKSFFRYPLMLLGAVSLSHPLFSGDMEELKQHEKLINLYGAFPTAKTFKANSAHTAAGALLYAYNEGIPYILLGQRKDCKEYCNLGGKSEDKHKTLAETAAQEVEEESLGVYAFNPTLLEQQPYVDLYSSPQLYRTYFQKVEYVPSEYLNKKLGQAKKPESEEYYEFIWVPLETIYTRVSEGTSSFLHRGKKINLYRPFMDSLSTPTSLEFLKKTMLVKPKKIRLRNRLYLNGNKENPEIKIHWDIPYAEKNSPSAAPVPLGQNAFREKVVKKQIIFKLPSLTTTLEQSIPIDPAKEKKAFAHSVAAKQSLLLEIKALNEKNKKEFDPLENGWPYKLTPTDLHLILCNAGFKKIFDEFEQHQSLEILQKDLSTAFAKVFATKSDYLAYRTAEAIAFAHTHSSWPAFSHGMSSGVAHLTKVFTALHQHLIGDPLSEYYAMRGTHLYFKDIEDLKGVKNIRKLIGNDRGDILLCLNSSIIGGGVDYSTSTTSSLGLWAGDHSIQDPDPPIKFEEATALLGMPTSYAPFESLLHQYTLQASSDHKNGMLFVIGINPDQFEDSVFSYEFISNGKGFNPYSTFYNIHQELANKDDNYKWQRRGIYPEVRLFLHPKMRPHVRMKAFPYYPLSSEKEKEFQKKLNHTLIAILGKWLDENTAIMPNSFLEPVGIKSLYKMIYENEIGRLPKESLTADGLNYLLVHDHETAVLDFLQLTPIPRLMRDVVKHAFQINKPTFLKSLKESHHLNFETFLSEQDVQDIILGIDSKRNRGKALLSLTEQLDLSSYSHTLQKLFLDQCFKRTADEAIEHFFKSRPHSSLNDYFSIAEQIKLYGKSPRSLILHTKDLKLFSTDALKYWLERGTLEGDSGKELTLIGEAYNQKRGFLPSSEMVMSKIVLTRIINQRYDTKKGYQFDGPLKAQKFVPFLLHFIKDNNLSYNIKDYSTLESLLCSLVKEDKINLTDIDPYTGEPLLFSMIKTLDDRWGVWDAVYEKIIEKHNTACRENSPQLSPLNMLGKERLTPVRWLQKRYMETFKEHSLLMQFYWLKDKNFLRSLYHPFYLKAIGLDHQPYTKNLSAHEKEWVNKWFQLIKEEASKETLQNHLENTPSNNCLFIVDDVEEELGVSTWDARKIAMKRVKNISEEAKKAFLNEITEGEREKDKKFCNTTKDENASIEEVLEAMEGIDFQEKDWLFTKLLEDRFIPFMDQILLKAKIQPHDEPKLYISGFMSKQFKLARYFYNKASDNKLPYLLHSNLLGNWPIYVQSYEKDIQKDFPEFLTENNPYISPFANDFRVLNFQYPRNFDKLKKFLMDNLKKLKGINPFDQRPYMAEIIHNAAFYQDFFELFVSSFKDHKDLLRVTFPDGRTLKDYLMTLEMGHYRDKEDIEKFERRKKTLLKTFFTHN